MKEMQMSGGIVQLSPLELYCISRGTFLPEFRPSKARPERDKEQDKLTKVSMILIGMGKYDVSDGESGRFTGYYIR